MDKIGCQFCGKWVPADHDCRTKKQIEPEIEYGCDICHAKFKTAEAAHRCMTSHVGLRNSQHCLLSCLRQEIWHQFETLPHEVIFQFDGQKVVYSKTFEGKV